MILNISGSSSVRNALDKRYHWTSVDPSDGAVLLWDRLADFPLAPDSDDELSWKWTASGGYTASSAYLALHNGATQLNGADRIWKTWAPLQVKFFLWLAVKHRHWTSDRRLRHGLTADPIYRHCDQENESSDHIIFRCSYSLQVWWVFLAPLHFHDITPQLWSRCKIGGRGFDPSCLRQKERVSTPCSHWSRGSCGRRGTLECSVTLLLLCHNWFRPSGISVSSGS